MTSTGRSLADALELIQSDRARDRNEGLAEVKRIFRLYQSSPEINRITDNSFHSLLEGLFRAVTREKANYSRSTKSRQQESTESRLNVCADALRSTIEASLPRLRLKSLNALIGHFIQILPNTDRTFFEPLSVSYLKSLSIVLGYAPHAEHLPQSSWNELVDLCLQGVQNLVERAPDGNVDSRFSFHTGGLDSLGSRFSQAQTTRQSTASAKSSSLFLCLKCLVNTSNHRLLDRVRQICDVTITYFNTTASNADALDAFIVLHKSFWRLSLESMSDTQQYLLRLLPIITTKWRLKAPELRDEMMKVLVTLQDSLLSMIDTADPESLQVRLDDLYEALVDDYVASESRPRRFHLGLEDINLDIHSSVSREQYPLHAGSIALRVSNVECDHNWTVLSIAAMLARSLARLMSRSRGDVDSSPTTPRKRRKLDDPLESALQRAAGSTLSVSSRVRWIQVIAFVCNTYPVALPTLEKLLAKLSSLIASSSTHITSWALIALSGCATQKSAASLTLQASWAVIWNAAFRLLSSAQSCRAACHTLGVMLRQDLGQHTDILKCAESMMSGGGLNHPATLCDSSIVLWTELQCWLVARRSSGAAARCSQEMVTFILARWTPSSFENRGYAVQCNRTLPVSLIISQILSVSEPPETLPAEYLACLHPVAQTWLQRSRCRKLTDYLLISDKRNASLDTSEYPSLRARSPRSSPVITRSESRSAFIAKVASEMDKVAESWQNDSESTGKKLLPESAILVFTLCLVSECLCNHPSTRAVASTRLSEPTKIVQSLALKQVSLDGSRTVLDGVAATMIQILQRTSCATKQPFSGPGSFLSRTFMERTVEVFQQAVEDSDVPSSDQVIDELDEMALDVRVVDSQSGHARSSSPLEARHVLEAAVTPHNFLVRTTSLIALASACGSPGVDDTEIPTSFADYVLTLSPQQLVSTRKLFVHMHALDQYLKIDDAERILVHLGESCMEDYLMRRCEVSICMVVQLLGMTIPFWTDVRNESIAGIGSQMYDWLIRANEAGICSSEVQMTLTDFLFKLIKFKSDYDGGSGRPSIRTSILRILSQGDLAVQDHVARQLPNLFGIYVISQHDLIFEDIHNSLPQDPDWIEGIAIRVLTLSILASSWSTLLRKCVYHIFETAALIVEAAPYTRHCLNQISEKLRLHSPKEILTLFRSQMIYTWLEQHSLESIPFTIFGFQSLRDLLLHSESEIVSQLVMRGYPEKLTNVQRILSLPEHDLLERDFVQAAAYSTASDVSTSSPDRKSVHSSEERITDVLGKARYVELLTKDLPGAVATLFLRLDGEESIEKAFLRRKGYESAGKAVRQMSIENEDALPLSQQPSFKAKYLVDCIERLCRRTASAPAKIWTPALTTTVFRILLNDAHPALGYFHTRRIIRRLRIAISLAGSIALKGYPLEMLLHSLRPYLSVNHCSQDAIGVYRYLLEQGCPYLFKVPSFVCGTSVSVYLGMRELLKSTQDSTTQESQHLAMLSRAEEFRGWLIQWLARYDSTEASEPFKNGMRTLLDAAQRVVGPGSSSMNNMHESKLLQCLLEDARQRKRVLTARFSELCIKLLCREFNPADSFRDDIVSKSSQAARVAGVLWRANQWDGLDRRFHLWTGRSLGRGFRYDGVPPRDLMPESLLGHSKSSPSMNADVHSSEAAICDFFLDMLCSEQPTEVAMAEDTLQRLLQASENSQMDSGITSWFPEHMRQALSHTTNDARLSRNGLQLGVASLEESFDSLSHLPAEDWLRGIVLALLEETKMDTLLHALLPAIKAKIAMVSSHLFPYILHLALEVQIGCISASIERISEHISSFFRGSQGSQSSHRRHVINALLYLLTQPYPEEKTKLDRHKWLSVDLELAAQVASECKMFKTALFLLEMGQSVESQHSRRSSSRSKVSSPSSSILLSVFKEIDEPDAFHGVAQNADLDAIAERLAFESAGSQELLIRGAQTDGSMRVGSDHQGRAFGNTVDTLARLNMSSLTYSLGLTQTIASAESASESVTKAAMRLKQWDVPLPGSADNHIGSLYHAFRSLQEASNMDAIKPQIDVSVAHTIQRMKDPLFAHQSLRLSLSTLMALNDADEMLGVRSGQDFLDAYGRLELRKGWTDVARLEDIDRVLAARETLFSVISDNSHLHRSLGINRRTAKLHEVKVNLRSSQILRSLGSFQQSLSNVAYLSEITPGCETEGLHIEYAVKQELSNVLWERGELVPSIQILKNLAQSGDFESQSIPVGRAGLLATLGKRVSDARLERPEEILNKYLAAAQKALKRQAQGEEAGHVYHEFANYCHAQLSNSDSLREYKRVQNFTAKRASEIEELDAMLKNKISEEQKQRAKIDRNRARKWLDIDRVELQRLENTRERFLRQSLENYMLALAASDDHETDVLRFVALWLEHADSQTASEAVSSGLGAVPLHKLAPLMNQLASRLQNEKNVFQDTMFRLVEQICVEHPWHGMYHIYAGCNTKGGNDPSAISRNAAANKIAARLQDSAKVRDTWGNVQKASDLYINLASYKSDALKSQQSLPLKNFRPSRHVEREIPILAVPPLTMSIQLRADCDYSKVSTVASFRPTMSIASGLSAPKILTVIASDGSQHKQLFKSGSDDLRQDAIMEQVFENVSSLLKSSRATRQRNLRIRTYKVVPLNATSGAIEFVQNTMALLEYIRPAHQRYYPKDTKWDTARQHIDDGRTRSSETRIRMYKEVADRFHPVLRHFFFERFEDPEEWFAKRLAYTRSTASISILGHAVGLGDRHCQNILLDTVTGEVVHIDLGVAFEAGRILAVPEVVPFRLTRDIVDGMGIMGVEGVFRRCCEFTLEALRNNRDAIMTLLNVLRYDPLYSWSLSPLRAKRLQDEQREREMSEQQQQQAENGKTTRRSIDVQALTRGKSRGEHDGEERDSGEADRALGVVERKLAPSLSVMATVNELIQQATDERNLALLFCGWAAYA